MCILITYNNACFNIHSQYFIMVLTKQIALEKFKENSKDKFSSSWWMSSMSLCLFRCCTPGPMRDAAPRVSLTALRQWRWRTGSLSSSRDCVNAASRLGRPTPGISSWITTRRCNGSRAAQPAVNGHCWCNSTPPSRLCCCLQHQRGPLPDLGRTEVQSQPWPRC